MKQLELAVILYLEDVAVATDEELGRTGEELIADAPVVAAGITSDMGHQHIRSLTSPSKLLRKHTTQVAAVAVADNGSQGSESSKAVGKFYGTDVARVPDLIALAEVLQVLVVPEGVSVRKEAYALHQEKEKIRKLEKGEIILPCLRAGRKRRGGYREQRGWLRSSGCGGEGERS